MNPSLPGMPLWPSAGQPPAASIVLGARRFRGCPRDATGQPCMCPPPGPLRGGRAVHTSACQQLREEFHEEVRAIQRGLAAPSPPRTRPSYAQVVGDVPPRQRRSRPVPQLQHIPPPPTSQSPGLTQRVLGQVEALKAFFQSEGLTPLQIDENLAFARLYLEKAWKPRARHLEALLPHVRAPDEDEDPWWAWAEVPILVTLVPNAPLTVLSSAPSRPPPAPPSPVVSTTTRPRGSRNPETPPPSTPAPSSGQAPALDNPPRPEVVDETMGEGDPAVQQPEDRMQGSEVTKGSEPLPPPTVEFLLDEVRNGPHTTALRALQLYRVTHNGLVGWSPALTLEGQQPDAIQTSGCALRTIAGVLKAVGHAVMEIEEQNPALALQLFHPGLKGGEARGELHKLMGEAQSLLGTVYTALGASLLPAPPRVPGASPPAPRAPTPAQIARVAASGRVPLPVPSLTGHPHEAAAPTLVAPGSPRGTASKRTQAQAAGEAPAPLPGPLAGALAGMSGEQLLAALLSALPKTAAGDVAPPLAAAPAVPPPLAEARPPRKQPKKQQGGRPSSSRQPQPQPGRQEGRFPGPPGVAPRSSPPRERLPSQRPPSPRQDQHRGPGRVMRPTSGAGAAPAPLWQQPPSQREDTPAMPLLGQPPAQMAPSLQGQANLGAWSPPPALGDYRQISTRVEHLQSGGSSLPSPAGSGPRYCTYCSRPLCEDGTCGCPGERRHRRF